MSENCFHSPEATNELEATTPEGRVELFLNENTQLFAQSPKAWQKVAEQHEQLDEALTGMYPAHNRNKETGIRKKINRAHRNNLGTMLNEAARYFDNSLSSRLADISSPEEQLLTLKEKVESSYEERLKTLDEAFDTKHMCHHNKTIRDYTVAQLALQNRYLLAYGTDAIIMSHISDFITNTPDNTEAFIQQIEDLADEGKSGLVEFPGFLTVVATKSRQENQQNSLREAILSLYKDKTETLALDFFRDYIERDSTQDLDTVVRFMIERVIASPELQLQARDGDKKTFVINRLAAQHEYLPPKLRTQLQQYILGRASHHWINLKQNLEPYVKEGRVPRKDNKITTTVHAGDLNKQLRGRSLSATSVAPSKRVDVFDVQEAPSEKIRQLATFSGNSNKDVRVLPLASIKETMELRFIKAFLKQYPKAESTILSTIEALQNDPYNRHYSRKLSGKHVTYSLAHMSAREKPRRLRRARAIPASDSNPQSLEVERLRITFDVVRYEGVPTLVLHDVFLKDDNSNRDKYVF